MTVYLNGSYVEDHQASISIWDAGFLFGEGIFTTLRLIKGRPIGLENHCQRLNDQAAELAIPSNLSFTELQTIVSELVVKNKLEQCDSRLRITVTRGSNPTQPMPLSINENQPSTLLLTLSALPDGFDDELTDGIKVITLGPDFTRHFRPDLKSLNYLPSLLAMREAQKQSCNEAIIFDENGFLTEAAMSNVFLCQSSGVLTPKNKGQILDGCTRQIIWKLARENQLSIQEKDLTREDLNSANEVFLCNSIREIVPVISIDGKPVADQMPGPITLKFRRWYRQALHTA